ncbi:MAG: rhomboid family intramembrane serine protease [Deltaproteobacteria bacterium]|nr:rhomboid family intramembrane serine protease [Deltaproteobacteria bacterium]
MNADADRPWKPWITYSLIGINVAVFLFCVVVGVSPTSPDPVTMHNLGGSSKVATLGMGEWWRVITAAFLHYGVIHLALNMYSLFALGGPVERMLGRPAYASVYFVSALFGGVVSLITMGRNSVSAGASGAVFGVIGALGAYLLVHRARIEPEVWKREMMQLGIMLAINLVYGFTNPGIDNGAHIGGLIAGAGATFLLARIEDDARKKRAWLVAAGGMATTLGLLFVLSR